MHFQRIVTHRDLDRFQRTVMVPGWVIHSTAHCLYEVHHGKVVDWSFYPVQFQQYREQVVPRSGFHWIVHIPVGVRPIMVFRIPNEVMRGKRMARHRHIAFLDTWCQRMTRCGIGDQPVDMPRQTLVDLFDHEAHRLGEMQRRTVPGIPDFFHQFFCFGHHTLLFMCGT